jgi:hypothetical protein
MHLQGASGSRTPSAVPVGAPEDLGGLTEGTPSRPARPGRRLSCSVCSTRRGPIRTTRGDPIGATNWIVKEFGDEVEGERCGVLGCFVLRARSVRVVLLTVSAIADPSDRERWSRLVQLAGLSNASAFTPPRSARCPAPPIEATCPNG